MRWRDVCAAELNFEIQPAHIGALAIKAAQRYWAVASRDSRPIVMPYVVLVAAGWAN